MGFTGQMTQQCRKELKEDRSWKSDFNPIRSTPPCLQ